MKRMLYAAMLFSISIAGCAENTGDAAAKTGGQPNQAAEVKPGDAEGKEVALTPENTKIQFVGLHTGDKPDPRTGTFGDFTGKATIDGDKLTGLNMDIKTESLATGIDKLDGHLKSADFFDVKQHPQAKFQSTAIEPDGEKVKVTGDLTLLGVTKSISFPATVSVKDNLSLKAEFKIDRTEFGMNYGEANVEKLVEMTVTVGK